MAEQEHPNDSGMEGRDRTDASTVSGPATEAVPFHYEQWRFLLTALPAGSGFRPVVEVEGAFRQNTQLPLDAEPYATREEALRHCEQQAVRWAHDRTGDGQGRF